MQVSKMIAALALAAGVFGGARASHAALALTFTGGGLDSSLETDYTMGWHFNVNTPINVTELGVWDNGGNGLGSAHPVAIWTEAGTLITSFTIPAGTGQTLDSGFRMEPITSTLLGVGSYRIGSYLPADNTDFMTVVNATASTIPEITYVDRAFLAASSGLNFPTGTNTNELAANFGPTFAAVDATTTAAPLPSAASSGLVGLALLAGASFLRKRFAAA